MGVACIRATVGKGTLLFYRSRQGGLGGFDRTDEATLKALHAIQ